MKPINEMILEELAEYAVTLDGWRWMPGMLVKYPNGGWYRLTDGDARPPDPRISRPDLTDPATLGCVLAMARKKHGEWVYTLPTGRGWRVLIGNPEERSVSVVSAKEEMPTEAHALIAALDAEVKP